MYIYCKTGHTHTHKKKKKKKKKRKKKNTCHNDLANPQNENGVHTCQERLWSTIKHNFKTLKADTDMQVHTGMAKIAPQPPPPPPKKKKKKKIR